MVYIKPLAAAVFLATAGTAQASSCDVLATFFGQVVKASGAEIETDVFKGQLTAIQQAKGDCGGAIARMEDAQTYTHAIGAPLTPLQDYLRKDARFAVRVVGKGGKVKAIEFDIDAVGALRKRPTR